MSREMPPDAPYWKELCFELEMSEDDVSVLLEKGRVERTEYIISLFSASQSECHQSIFLKILADIGDAELVGNFYVKILEDRASSNRLKFVAATQGQLGELKNHSRLSAAIATHLQGCASPMEVWIRNAFPNGYCPLREGPGRPRKRNGKLRKARKRNTGAVVLPFGRDKGE